jgi:hypothetical protein
MLRDKTVAVVRRTQISINQLTRTLLSVETFIREIYPSYSVTHVETVTFMLEYIDGEIYKRDG